MTASTPSGTYYRKGLGLRADVQDDLDADYSGSVVDLLRENDYTLTRGEVTVRLAREFGFCYGVERAVDYAYQTRRKFPERRVFLVGEIIHNPHVNEKLRRMGIEILAPNEKARPEEARFDYRGVTPADVVILPAFGVTIRDFETLRALGCTVVDTTCGSVLNVWKRVEGYARDAFTALIHGKYYHEETRATASQVELHAQGQYLIVRDMHETEVVCDLIRALARGAAREASAAFLERFAAAVSTGFDPERHLRRIGVANQTTMLARESLAIGERVGATMSEVWGDAWRAENFRNFDTICSATQDRQDAVDALLRERPDAMVVIGGYNSSNTISLAAICAERAPTFHVEDASSIDVAARRVRFRPAGVAHAEEERKDWLPTTGPLVVGVTAGASTPNNRIGETVERIFATRGIRLAP